MFTVDSVEASAMCIRRIGSVLLWAALLTSCSANPARVIASGRPAFAVADARADEGIFRGTSFTNPFGKFTLIRWKEQLCAVKFVAASDAREAPGAYEVAQYESYFQGDGSGDLSKPNTVKTAGYAFRSTSGTPNRALPPLFASDPYIMCGSTAVHWVYPDGLHFFGKAADGTHIEGEFLFAPTGYDDVRRVDLGNPRLRWFAQRAVREADWEIFRLQSLPN